MGAHWSFLSFISSELLLISLNTLIIRAFVISICFLLNSALVAQNADHRFLIYLTKNTTKKQFSTYNNISKSAYIYTVGVPLTQGLIYLSNPNSKNLHNVIKTTCAIAINSAFTWGLKYTINRSRPEITFAFPTHKPNDPSFPSGHTSYSFSIATSLAVQYKKWYISVPAYAWAGAIGFSRLKTGVHYPTDVLGGAIIGVGSAYLSHKLNIWVNKKGK